MKVKLITGRTIDQGKQLEAKMTPEYQDAVAICELSGNTVEKLGISDNVRVETEFGSVVVKAKRNDKYPDDIAFIPMGPWANAVISGDTHGVGMPQYKGIDAEITPTEEEVLSIRELIKSYKG